MTDTPLHNQTTMDSDPTDLADSEPTIDQASLDVDNGEGAAATTADAQQPLVPLSESRKYRKRAQAAEQQAAELQQQLEQQKQAIAQRDDVITSLERRQAVDSLLIDADVVDLDAARLLTEAALGAMDEPDVEEAVEDLRRHKPFLFRSTAQTASNGVMSPRQNGQATTTTTADDSLNHAAAEAYSTGSRTDLLRYLRLRRRS